MPTYEYRCATCGGRFETFQSITADALVTCNPELCQSEKPEVRGRGDVRRIVSGGAGVVFRGEGFYLTDYARKGNPGGGEGKSAKGDSSDLATGGASDGKPSSSSASGSDSSTKEVGDSSKH